MSYHDDGRPHVIDFGKNIHNPLRRFRIQIACRFVGNEQERPVDDGSGNGYTLLFATTEIRRQGIGFAHQADQVENVVTFKSAKSPEQHSNVTPQDMEDTAKEFFNVLCGNACAGADTGPGFFSAY